jgi:ABC transport system ATP-binding/permease protein
LALLLNTQNLTKAYGAAPLFTKISFPIHQGNRVGLIGPNGAGKSTLIEILAGKRSPDEGEVAVRKGVRMSYVQQASEYKPGETTRFIVRRAMREASVPEGDWDAREAETLGRAGFEDFDAEGVALSGGWRKRLAIVEALVQGPDLLLLDEPTNHLDLGGILWLEKMLQSASFSCVVISHDRYFLENVATDVMELNRAYPDGLFRVRGNYSQFLVKKDEYLHAQAKRQEALENRVRTEIDWLRRGPKARTTKSKARIDNAHELIGELSDIKARRMTSSTEIDFSASDRKTKRLVEFDKANFAFGGKKILSDFSFVFTAGTRIGLVGPNGSGKTTLLRLLRDDLKVGSGEIRRADFLRVVYFDQNRILDPVLTLRNALSPDGDSVIFQEREIHVAAWADRFLFQQEQLNQPVGRLSGGERARVLIARLMLEPADLLLLDEPTNDLDIPTLEILEESLLTFPGALVLVTHDRYMLDRVSTVVLGLSGTGEAERFADYSQWEAWQQEITGPRSKNSPKGSSLTNATPAAKKKLSYLEQREYDALEQRISDAEAEVMRLQRLLESGEVATDGKRLQETYASIEPAQGKVDELYARWAELEAKIYA